MAWHREQYQYLPDRSRCAGIFSAECVRPKAGWCSYQPGWILGEYRRWPYGSKIVDGGRYTGTTYGFQTMNRANARLFDGLLTLTGDATFQTHFWKNSQDGRPYSIGYGPSDTRLEGGEGYALERRTSDAYNAYNFFCDLEQIVRKAPISGYSGIQSGKLCGGGSPGSPGQIDRGLLALHRCGIGWADRRCWVCGLGSSGYFLVDWITSWTTNTFLNLTDDTMALHVFQATIAGDFSLRVAAWIVSEEDFFRSVSGIFQHWSLGLRMGHWESIRGRIRLHIEPSFGHNRIPDRWRLSALHRNSWVKCGSQQLFLGRLSDHERRLEFGLFRIVFLQPLIITFAIPKACWLGGTSCCSWYSGSCR